MALNNDDDVADGGTARLFVLHTYLVAVLKKMSAHMRNCVSAGGPFELGYNVNKKKTEIDLKNCIPSVFNAILHNFRNTSIDVSL